MIALCIITTISAQAQNPGFRQFSTDEGLPSNEVYKVIEDRQGHLWMGTDRGLVRYDGYSFDVFTTEDGLTDNVIFWIYEDYKGRLWFACLNRSLCYYENGQFYEHAGSKALMESPTHLVLSIYVDHEDKIWLGVNGKDPILKVHPDGRIEGYCPEEVGYWDIIVQDIRSESTLFGACTDLSKRGGNDTIHEFFIYNEEGDLIQRMPQGSSVSPVYSAARIGEKMFISKGNDLYLIGDSLTTSHLELGSGYDICLYEDNEAFLWAGMMKGGILRFAPDNIEEPVAHLLKGYSVTSVTQDRENGYWFSTIEEGVFFCPSLEIDNLTVSSNTNDKKTLRISASDHSIWAGSAETVYEIVPGNRGYEIKERQKDIGLFL